MAFFFAVAPLSSLRPLVSATQLGFKHMSKCGGTDVVEVLRHAGINFTLFDERTGLSAERKKRPRTFVIASARNPCSYALSLWAYQGGKPWAAAQNDAAHALGITFWNRTGSHIYHSSTMGFVDWTRLTMKGRQHSIMAYRFFETLIEQTDSLHCFHDSLFHCASHFDDASVEQGLLSFAKLSQVDCWVFLESLCAPPPPPPHPLAVGVWQVYHLCVCRCRSRAQQRGVADLLETLPGHVRCGHPMVQVGQGAPVAETESI